MNIQHTPGPWTHKDHNDETSAIFAGEDRDLIADARTVADARLIAAAPELLAVLKEMLEDCDHSVELECVHGGEVVERARAAIAKAEGT